MVLHRHLGNKEKTCESNVESASLKPNGKEQFYRRPVLFSILIILMLVVNPLLSVAQWSPDDTHYMDHQWNLQEIDNGGASFDWAWDLSHQSAASNTGANEIVVAVIDSGINMDHEDLQGILWTNRNEIAGNSEDDDDNGRADDIHGWDYWGDDNDPDDEGYTRTTGVPPNEVTRTIYHGTFIAGQIAATMNDNQGIAGGAEVSIMPLRIFGGDAGSWVEADMRINATKAIEYAYENGADIISMSFTFNQSDNDFNLSIENAYDHGCVLIAGVDNDDDYPIYYPAFRPEVLAVGGYLANWGNGNYNFTRDFNSATGNELDILGPRSRINASQNWTGLTSTWGHDDGDPEGRANSYNIDGNVDGLWDPNNNATDQYFVNTMGNSYVVSQVAATAALMLSVRPSLTNIQVYNILRATTRDVVVDITTSTNNLFGHDIYSGFGALNTFQAVSFANNWPNQWGQDKKVSDMVQTATNDRASIDVDSMGYSHIVWIDDFRHEIYYRSLDPNGNVYVEKIPLEANTPSERCEEPRVTVDREDNVHIAWLKRRTPVVNPEIRYIKMSPNGTVSIGPKFIVHDGGQNWKFDLNLLVTDNNPVNNDPTAIVIYTKQVNGNRFDIWMSRMDALGIIMQGFPVAVVADNFDQIRVAAAIFNVEIVHQRQEFIHLVFKDSDSALGNYDLQWMAIDIAGSVWQAEASLVNNGDTVNYPDVDCVYDGGNAGIVWTQNGWVTYALLDAFGNLITFNEGHLPVRLSTGGGNEATRVAINQHQQVGITFTNGWNVFLAELSLDGRLIQINDIGAVTLAGSPEIVATADDSHISDRYDLTGNFYMIYCGNLALGVGSDLMWRSTGFSTRTPSLLFNEQGINVHDTFVTVDMFGGIHVAYSRDSYDSVEVYYQYFKSASSFPTPDGFELLVSDNTTPPIPPHTDGNDSRSPRIVTICDYKIIDDEPVEWLEVYFFWLDERDVEDKYNIYMRGIEFSSDGMNEVDLLPNKIERCHFSPENPDYSITDYDVNLKFDGLDIANSDYLYDFFIVWANYTADNLEMAELEIDNSGSQTIFVTDDDQLQTSPSIVSDWYGDAYIAYEQENRIRLTKMTHDDFGDLVRGVPTWVTDANDVCSDPKVLIDRNTNRIDKEDGRCGVLPNDYYSDRGSKYIHIFWAQETVTPDQFVPFYGKYDNDDLNEILNHGILPATSNFYFNGSGLNVLGSLDCDNRVVLGIQGEMNIGPNPEWRDSSDFQGVHNLRLDNNGEILVHEALASHDGQVISYSNYAKEANIAVDIYNPDTTYTVWISAKDGYDALYITYSATL